MNMHDEKQTQIRSDTLGKAVARHLTDGADELPHDITERLKAARAQAVAKRKIMSVQVASAGALALSAGEVALSSGGPDGGWFNRVASLIPLLALIAGLVSIAVLQDDDRTRELAEVDAELLTDELPPAAFTDPGFAQYLRINNAR
jgi:hypothetical protein